MKPQLYRFLIIFSIINCLGADLLFAQVNYEGQVVDKTTESPIPFVTVTLSKARVATRTNDQGFFSLSTPSGDRTDSLIFTCIGYQTYRLPMSVYKPGMFISMQPNSTKLKEVAVGNSKVKTKTLRAFTLNELDIRHMSLWLDYPNEFFRSQMYAKLFEMPKPNGRVIRVDLSRWQSDYTWSEQLPSKNSKFKIHIMTVSPATGAPDSVLVTKEVTLRDRSRNISVSLDSAYAIIPTIRFFITIEWLRIPYNEYIFKRDFIRDALKNTQHADGSDRIIYQPLLAQYTSSKAPSWQMTDGIWKLFEHPKFEIALSATVKY